MSKYEICAEWDHRAGWMADNDMPDHWKERAAAGWRLVSVVPVDARRMAYFQRELVEGTAPVPQVKPAHGNKKLR